MAPFPPRGSGPDPRRKPELAPFVRAADGPPEVARIQPRPPGKRPLGHVFSREQADGRDRRPALPDVRAHGDRGSVRPGGSRTQWAPGPPRLLGPPRWGPRA